jgi:hypothetical protein
MPLQELFVRSYHLLQNLDGVANKMDLLIDNLAHNHEAEGGCLAGIAGRLIQVYTNGLFWNVQQILRINIAPRPVDEALEQALALSLVPQDDVVLPDDELELVRALSLSEEIDVVLPMHFQYQPNRNIANANANANDDVTAATDEELRKWGILRD